MGIIKSSNIKVSLILLGLIALIGTIYTMYRSDSSKGGSRPAVAVEYLKVEKQKLIEQLEALGTTAAMKSITITAGVAEKLASIEVDEGQFVKQGDLIVTLSKDQEEAEKQAVSFEVKEHQRELKRLKQLVKQNAAPQSRLDSRRTELLKAEAYEKQIDAKISDRELRAPFDGVLGLMNVSVGALVRPGDPITTLDAIDPMRVDLIVPARYLGTIKVSLPITAHSSIFEQSFDGELTSIDSRIDARTRSVRVRARIPNPEHMLKPGMLLNVMIAAQERQAIVLPEIAVFSKGEQHFVYVIGSENSIEERPVEIGYRRPGKVEITNGLELNERVVVEGIVKLRPGVAVDPKPFQSGDIENAPSSQAS